MSGDTQDVARRDEEGAPAKKIPYPKSVIFICANEFCERFSYYGMRAILSIYLRNIIGYSENTATMVYHLFIVFCYLTPTMGAMLADSVLGKFRTIFYLSIVYAAGQVLLALTSIPKLNFPEEAMSLIGLALIALGTGGIKPCVSSFGADQFKMPEQASYVAAYFSIFYFCINAGSLISTFITPIFRQDITCFGKESCYPLAFGVPAALMVVSLLIFIAGRPLYKINKPSGNIFAQIVKNIFHALSRKRQLKHEKRAHFMDYADDTLTRKEIEGIKVLLQVLWLYLPLPLYWALYDQQGSRWTFQATRMDGSMGSFSIKPDQMQLINAFLILLFIPLFEKVVYPLLGKCNLITKPLQRLTVGGIMIGVAFIVSGLIELKLQSTYPVDVNSGFSHIQIINTLDFNVTGEYKLGNMETFQFAIEREASFLPDKALERGEGEEGGMLTINFDNLELAEQKFKLEDEKTSTFLIHQTDPTKPVSCLQLQDHPDSIDLDKELPEHSAYAQVEKSEDALPYLRIIQMGVWTNCESQHCTTKPEDACKADDNIKIVFTKEGCEEDEEQPDDYEPICITNFNYTSNCSLYSNYHSTFAKEMDAGKYNVTILGLGDDEFLEEEVELKTGGSYTYTVVRNSDGSYIHHLDTVTEPNSVHMLWLLPQYVILTAAEVMFSVTIMDFSYAEAPVSMKSVLQACWLLTVAGGNIIIAIVAELSIFDKQWKEFFLFAGLMFASMAIFAYMAYLYKPANLQDFDNDDDEDDKKKGKTNDGFKDDKDD